MNFVYGSKKFIGQEYQGFWSVDPLRFGDMSLSFLIYLKEEDPPCDQVKESCMEFCRNQDFIAARIIADLKEKYNETHASLVHPHKKIIQDLERSISMMGSAGESIRPKLMQQVSPRNSQDDALSFEQYVKNTRLLATICPWESKISITIICQDPYFYHPQDVVFISYYQGKFIDHEELERLIKNEFNAQDGDLFNGVKFIGCSKIKPSKYQVLDLEKSLGLIFPESYRDFLLQVDGGTPALENARVCPQFYAVNDNSLRKWNENGCGGESTSAGFLTIADAGMGFGGETVIYCRKGDFFGKVFSWHNDGTCSFDVNGSLSDPNNLKFLMENHRADDFGEHVSNYLCSEKNLSDDEGENLVDILSWLNNSNSNKLEPYNHKESLKFIEKIYAIGVEKIENDGYLDFDEEDEIYSFAITFPDSPELRQELIKFFHAHKWDVQKTSKTHWSISFLN